MPTPYLLGVHAPVSRSHEAYDLPVTGAIPPELNGSFVRNSANPVFPPSEKYHWFDGDGMVHAVHLEGGRATYRNRWIETEGWKAEKEAGRPLWRGINERPDPSSPGGPVKDTANTHLIAWDGQLLATWWLSGQPMALELPSLRTTGPGRVGGASLPRMAAHPKVDPRTGELVFMAYDAFRPPYMRYGVAHPDGRVQVSPIDLPHGHIPHDIGITERYSVLMDFPLGWGTGDGKRRITFFGDRPARFGIVPRWGRGEDVRWFEHDPCYLYHLDGTWEEGDDIVIVGCRIADPIPADRPAANQAMLDTIALVPHLYRWRIHLPTGRVTGEVLDDTPTEFPRVDDRTWGRPVRHVYHPRVAAQPALTFDGLVAYDLVSGGRRSIAWPDGFTSGEVVFAPRPGGVDGDDGWLLTVLSHPDGRASRFVVLDASSLAPVATVALPDRVPQGFHADWVAAR